MGGPGFTSENVIKQVVDSTIALHCSHWMDREFLIENKDWLKGAGWILGEDRASWQFCMDEIALWHEVTAKKHESGEI